MLLIKILNSRYLNNNFLNAAVMDELSVLPKTRIYGIVNLQHQRKPGDVCKKLLEDR